MEERPAAGKGEQGCGSTQGEERHAMVVVGVSERGKKERRQAVNTVWERQSAMPPFMQWRMLQTCAQWFQKGDWQSSKGLVIELSFVGCTSAHGSDAIEAMEGGPWLIRKWYNRMNMPVTQ
jgi:hypothetical protein